jgi:peptidoglycan hydrolase-like protein with peptidoglycan-binding domain
LYNGPINDEPDEGFVSAVKEFQKSRNVQADGVFGVSTFRALQDAAPDFFPDAWATRL